MARPKIAGYDINAFKKEWGVVEEPPAPSPPSMVSEMRTESIRVAGIADKKKKKNKKAVKYVVLREPTRANIETASARPKRIKSIMQAQKEAKLNADFDKYFETRGGRIYRKPEKQGLGKLLRKAGDAIARRKSLYR